MQFLIETALVQRVEKKAAPLIGLKDANLSDANLTGFPLMDADLNNADLSNANLHVASMSHANLFQADQSGADLIDADLTDQWADLSDANLRNADLRGADLSGADLSFANLRNADLSSANLSDANLIGADGVSKEMLEQQTKFLSNTTMPDGTVFFGEFEPALSLNLGGSVLGGSDWYVSAATPDSISISRIADYGLLLFTNSLQVFDPSKPSEPKELSEPENAKEWVAWFQSHPNLDTSKPLPVRVGGASGKQIDVTVPSTPENYTQDVCYGEPCVPRYRLSDENGIIGYEGYKDRFIIVDVGGETVLIDAAARAEKFDEFLPKMQKVLDSVEWKGG